MKTYLLLTLCFLAGCFKTSPPSFDAETTKAEIPTLSKSYDQLKHNVIRCMIFDMEGRLVWNYEADLCLFLDDGRLIAGKKHTLSMFSATMELLWEKEFEPHHQMNLGITPNTFVVLGEEYRQKDGQLGRFDVAVVFDFDGKELKRFSFYDHFDELYRRSADKTRYWDLEQYSRRRQDVAVEYSHANSFYEIPENTLSKHHKAFQKGNYIINSNLQFLTFIVDSKMKSILWHLDHRTPSPRGNNAHDVQVLPNGRLLVYGNEDRSQTHSSIYELDPVTQKMKILFYDNPRTNFYSVSGGSAQFVSENRVLYSDMTAGAWAYESTTEPPFKRVWSMEFKMFKPPMVNQYTQVKRYDLSGFLKNNQGL